LRQKEKGRKKKRKGGVFNSVRGGGDDVRAGRTKTHPK